MNKPRKATTEPQKLALPVLTQDDWDALVREQKLTPEQALALTMTLEHLYADLALEQAKRDAKPPRDQLVMRLERMEAHLASLLEEMERAKADMIHFLPSASLAEIGRAMTFQVIGEALGQDVVPERFKETNASKTKKLKNRSPAEMEEATLPARESLGLKHGDVILRDFLDRVHKPMRSWIEKDKENSGGKPPQILRRHIVYALARSAPEIIGRKAAISETGPFVELCAAVLRSLRLPDDGVGKIAPDVVRQLRADQGIGGGPIPRRKRMRAERK